MKLFMRSVLVICVAVLVFFVAGVVATWAPDRSVESLAGRWAAAPSSFLDMNGLRVHLRDEGPQDDPHPIVLLHGTSDSLHTWQGWAEGLRGSRRVIRFDLPGFGLTGPNLENDYSVDAYARFVIAVLDKLGVQSVVLAGNSLGGQIAWETARAAPARVDKLVLVDSAGYALQPQSVPVGFRLARMPGVRVLMEFVLPRGVVQSSLRNVYGDASLVTPEVVDRFYELTLRAGNRKALGLRMEQLRNSDEAKIKSLKVPTLIIWGGKDRLIPLGNANRFASDIAHSKLVVFEKLGHVPQEEDAQGTLEALRLFLN
jgi:pimeloyl-ACP methyl ester carboxylesterase